MTNKNHLRTRDEVNQQLRQVCHRHKQRLIRAAAKPAPKTCRHNMPLDLSGSTVFVCGKMDSVGQPRGVVCDGRNASCVGMAKRCPYWEPLHLKEDILNQFDALLEGEIGYVAVEYPDIASLLWMLGSGPPPKNFFNDKKAKAKKGWFSRLFSELFK